MEDPERLVQARAREEPTESSYNHPRRPPSGTILVPRERMTRPKSKAFFDSLLGTASKPPSPQVEQDVELATILDEDVRDALGEALTTSDGEEDSEFEDPGSAVRNTSSKRSVARKTKRIRGVTPPRDNCETTEARHDGEVRPKKRTERRPKARRRSESIESAGSSVESPTNMNAGPVDVTAPGPNPSSSSDEDVEEIRIPHYLLDLDGAAPPMNGSFARGLEQEFDDWEAFDAALDEFTQARYQLFKIRTSTSVDRRNLGVRKPGLLVPTILRFYARTHKCVHGMSRATKKPPSELTQVENLQVQKRAQKPTPKTRKTKHKPSRKRSVKKTRFTRDIQCKATVNATVQRVGDEFNVRWNATGATSTDNRGIVLVLPQDSSTENCGVVLRRRPNAQLWWKRNRVVSKHRRETGLPSQPGDFQNVIGKVWREKVVGPTEEARLDSRLRTFVGSAEGNWATRYINERTDVVESVAFQSARMKRLFAAGPQVVMVDCTFGTNKSKYTMFSFCLHDIFGKGQYVFHSLIHRETMDYMEDSRRYAHEDLGGLIDDTTL